MLTTPQDDPVTFWQPSPLHPNVVMVAPDLPEWRVMASQLGAGDEKLELVHVLAPSDAMKLVERGRITAVILSHPVAEEGCVELLVTGFSRQQGPKFLIFSVAALPVRAGGFVKLLRPGTDAASVKKTVQQACSEILMGKEKTSVSPAEFLAGVAGFPEPAWIRITNERGASGDICFRNGQAIYSETGRLSSLGAAQEILSWGPSKFEYRPLPSFLQGNLDARLVDLLAGRGGAPAPVRGPEPAAGQRQVSEPVRTAPAHVPQPASYQPAPSYPPPPPNRTPSGQPPPPVRGFGTRPAMTPPAPSPGLHVVPPPAPPPPVPDDDLAIEEPQELAVWQVSETAEEMYDLEEPPVPSFAAEEPPAPAFAAEAGDFRDLDLRSTLFDAAVLLDGGEIVACEPKSEVAHFDAVGTWGLFEGVRQLSKAQKLGVTQVLQIRCNQASLALAQAADGRRLLAARVKGAHFGAAEEMELRRLLELVAARSLVGAV